MLINKIIFIALIAIGLSFNVRAFLNSLLTNPTRVVIAWVIVMITDVVLACISYLTAFYILNWN